MLRPLWLPLALVQVPASEDFPEGDPCEVQDEKGEYKGFPEGCVVRCLRRPFQREPDFGVTSVNYNLRELWEQGVTPC